jgi:hypothetical protein
VQERKGSEKDTGLQSGKALKAKSLKVRYSEKWVQSKNLEKTARGTNPEVVA